GTAAEPGATHVSCGFVKEMDGLVKIKIDISDHSPYLSSVPATHLVQIVGPCVFHIIEVHAVIDVHVAVSVRNANLKRYSVFTRFMYFFCLILAAQSRISDLLVFSSIRKMEVL